MWPSATSDGLQPHLMAFSHISWPSATSCSLQPHLVAFSDISWPSATSCGLQPHHMAFSHIMLPLATSHGLQDLNKSLPVGVVGGLHFLRTTFLGCPLLVMTDTGNSCILHFPSFWKWYIQLLHAEFDIHNLSSWSYTYLSMP